MAITNLGASAANSTAPPHITPEAILTRYARINREKGDIMFPDAVAENSGKIERCLGSGCDLDQRALVDSVRNWHYSSMPQRTGGLQLPN